MPSGRSVASAISASDRSAKKRSATTSRYGSSRAATAARSCASRSDRRTALAGSPGLVPAIEAEVAAGSMSRDRVEPDDLLALCRAPDREAHGDPREPRAERAFGSPGGQRPVRGHERLLGHVLGLDRSPRIRVQVAITERLSRSTSRRKASRSPPRTASTTSRSSSCRRVRRPSSLPGPWAMPPRCDARAPRRGHRAEPRRLPTPSSGMGADRIAGRSS